MNKVILKPVENSYHMNEGIKTMRTNLLFMREDRKVILFTSTIEGEGKSDTALAMAKSLAELDKKVLLIDTDLRKSIMATKLNQIGDGKGLSHFLSGQEKISEVIMATDINNFHILLSGATVMNSAELLSSPLFGKMIQTLRDHYDYIIVDSSPVGLVVDSAIVSENVDAAIFVVESGKIKYKFAQKAIAGLERSGCPVLGVIVNKFDIKKGGEYYTKYYHEYSK